MNHLKLLTLCSSLLIFFSCGGEQSSDESEFPQVIPFEEGMENEQEILLSQIAEKVEYIPLETNSKCLVYRPANYVRKVDGNYIIPCNEAVYMFDKKGKFICQIGRKGNGPGEYNYVDYVDVDTKNELIYVLTASRKVNVYSYTGEFIKQQPVPNVWNFGKLDDDLFAGTINNSNGQKKERVLLLNEKGDTIRAFPNYDFYTVASGMSYVLVGDNDRNLFRYKNHLCYKDYLNDTLYTITETALLPRYIVNMGRYRLPLEESYGASNGNWRLFESRANKYLQVNVIEAIRYVFIHYWSWAGHSHMGLMLYDKDKKICSRMKELQIQNDLEGGVPFQPFTSDGDNTLLVMWTPDKILEFAEKNPSILKHDKLKNLKEDDNPVLMLVHLKK